VIASRGQNFGSVSDLLWVRHESGTSWFAGQSDLPIGPDGPPLPLARGMWLQAQSDEVRATTMDTAACLRDGQAFAGFALLRRLFRGCAVHILEAEELKEAGRLERKAESEERLRAKGIADLASVLMGRSLEATVGGEEDPLVRACRVIGEASGIAFKAPPKWEESSRARDPLAAICRASRVRSRRLTLRGEWWKRDNGNLLGFIEKTESPVALIRTRKGYDLIDPMSMTRSRITAEIAATLNWEAYAFYKPLPDSKIDGRGLLRRILGEARADLRFILLMALASGLLSLLVPMATEHMLGRIVPSALRSQVWMLLLGLCGVHVGIALFSLARAFTLVRVEGISNSSLQSSVVDRMLALPVPFFRENPVGELAMRALSVNAARAVITGAASVSILAGVFSLLYLILLIYYNWRLALAALAIILICVGWVVFLGRRVVALQRAYLSAQGKVSALVFQMISGIAKLRVAAAEGRLFAKWADRFREQAELAYRSRTYQNRIKVFDDLLPLLSSLLLFAAAGYLVRQGTVIDTATFVAFNSAYGALFASLVQFGDTVVAIMGVRPIIERARPILETIPEVEANKPDPGALTGRLEANHLTFRYRDDGPLILDDVSFHANPGEYIVLVGPSGSGKSTVMRLLLGFEAPTGGAIYYDGQDLTSVDLSGVRSQIGVVLQNSRLIAGSIFENITGSAPLTVDDAFAAAEMAGLGEEIKEFPMGMHTVVSEGGGNLSGGQQQRLLIARALVRRPRLVFFDEATSALDNRVQGMVSGSLDRLNATRVVIAHRLSTIRNADRVYVMDRGKIVQCGSFSELASRPGMFADLIARQTL
jgi:NHLM bacteriocin system ABC transporter ATP-binding protein